MEYVLGYDFNYKNTAITLGKFDGIHRGHQMLVDKVVYHEREGLTSVMFTFLSNPQNLLQDIKLKKIYTEKEKRTILDSWGLDVLITYPFNKEVASVKAYDFVKEVLIDQLDVKMIVVGEDFRFGHNREGDVALLRKLSSKFDFELVVFDDLKHNDRRVSSTYVKEALAEGNMELANQLLGTPYTIFGKVIHGKKLGRNLGFPTINTIPHRTKLLPPDGVYITNTLVEGKSYPGITNIGYNPTVGKTTIRRAETYLFNVDEDLYGADIRVQILSRVRQELKFDNTDKLIEQVDKDILKGRAYFALD